MTPEEILERAKELEAQAIKEYQEMKKKADPVTSELLDYLISQERAHQDDRRQIEGSETSQR